MSKEIIREFEEETLTGAYSPIVPAKEIELGNKMIIRNTLADRIRIRIDGDDENSFTVSPGSQFILGGFTSVKRKLIEAKTETDIEASLRINIFS
jgi:hypothetical protein